MKTLIFIFVLLVTTCLFSTIINVPADQPTIQAGIDISVNADTVLVQPGTYFENINYNGKLITVASLFLTTQDTTYISQTIIDGNHNGSVVTFCSGEDSTAVLSGFSITNGHNGGGGGIFIINSNPIIIDVTISNNEASLFGGGICCRISSSSLVNVTISGNTTSCAGGGLSVLNSDIDIINCSISDNHADSDGGGVAVLFNAEVNLTNCTISGNCSDDNGGGIAFAGSGITVINSIVEGNEAASGAGIHFNLPENVDISFCNFYNGPENFSGYVQTGLGDITGINLYGTSCDDFFNIFEDPLFAGSGGYPFSLLEDSPCIDSGIQDTTGLNLPLFDIIGNERIVDGRGDGFAFIDMGAYEFGAPPYIDVDDNVIVQSPEVFLHQNYPNPFNPSTTISFSIEQNQQNVQVELAIYNLKGQKVKDLSPSLCHPEFIEGRGEKQYSVVWNGTDENNKPVSSGSYFYKLKTGNFEKTKKMILLR